MEILDSANNYFTLPLQWFKESNSFFYAHFGFFGQLAFDLLLIYFFIMVVLKVTKTFLHIVFYVVVPSLALSFFSSFVLPFGFAPILLVCVALMIIINMLRYA